MNAPERGSTEDLIGRALRTDGGHLSIGRGGYVKLGIMRS